jgi:glyoxylase-like metal-dependent hydrolase (beta-lactamase superfamily II)
MRVIDVRHLGTERVIGAWLVDGCLVDPGPSSALDGLLEGLGDERPQRILLTHIHLDHAGATGKLVERWPDVEVWVHERGAPHVADPSKLVASATRIYGEHMDRLWGEIVPVPRDRLRVFGSDGEERVGDWRIAYTPGHASHHVSYLHAPTATVFAGDTAGVRIGSGPVLPPTPPPDIDLEQWARSIDLIAAWRPDRVAVTHFGAFDEVDRHLGELRDRLRDAAEWARELDADAYAERVRAFIAGATDAETAAEYEQAMPPNTLFAGLERALRRVASSSG